MAVANLPQVNTPFLMDNPIFDVGQFQSMMQVAEVMSQAQLVPKHLQNKPADCLLVVEQARRWNMSPFAVAQETYVIAGKLLFGGKLVTAVINSRAPVKSPLRFTFEGEGDQCEVTVSATLKGDDEPRTYSITVGEAKAVAGNSTLWKTDPKQQVCYFAARFWARRHCPETLLGVWSEDEIDDKQPMRDVTPRDISRASYPPKEIVVVDPFGEEFALLPGELGPQLDQWCRECTDDELTGLKESNPSLGLLITTIDSALDLREAKRANEQQPGLPLDEPDPLKISHLSAKEVIATLEYKLKTATRDEADRILAVYRPRLEAAAPKAYAALAALVAEKIEGGR